MITLSLRSVPLPPRYECYWGTEFWGFVHDALTPGCTVLDIGAGRRPTIAPGDRPCGSHYVGLDISAEELTAAAPGSYDDIAVASAEDLLPELADRFDLIVAWQALEHVQDMRGAARAFHAYAKPGSWFVACLSGRNAVFAIANRILPTAAGRGFVSRLMRRPVDSVFPAHYDHCDERGLRSVFSAWDELHVIPLWRGADYFKRLWLLLPSYIRYENWAMRQGFNGLATHYVVAARKGYQSNSHSSPA